LYGLRDFRWKGKIQSSKNFKNWSKCRNNDIHSLLTVQKTAEELNMSRETVRLSSTRDLNMKKVCVTMVPKNVNSKQKMKKKVLEEPDLWKEWWLVMRLGFSNAIQKQNTKAFSEIIQSVWG
jgi:hypothetical protein